MIGIMGAMDEEVNAILKKVNAYDKITFSNRDFIFAKYKNIDLIIVKSGIGMVNASITATILYSKFNVDKIIFSGVAGSTYEKLKQLDLVIANSFVEYEFDVTEFGYEKGQIAGTTKRDIDANLELLRLTDNIEIDVKKYYGKIATADKFVSKLEDKKSIYDKFDAICVDMESASVAQACIEFNIPYLIIRSISDSLTDDSLLEYNELVDKASSNSSKFLIKLLDKLG